VSSGPLSASNPSSRRTATAVVLSILIRYSFPFVSQFEKIAWHTSNFMAYLLDGARVVCCTLDVVLGIAALLRKSLCALRSLRRSAVRLPVGLLGLPESPRRSFHGCIAGAVFGRTCLRA
jgi:hypothetical protein